MDETDDSARRYNVSSVKGVGHFFSFSSPFRTAWRMADTFALKRLFSVPFEAQGQSTPRIYSHVGRLVVLEESKCVLH